MTRAQVLTVLAAYGLDGARRVRTLRGGNPAAPKAVADTPSGRYLIKRRDPLFSDFARIQAEHAAQSALQSAGLPVPAPVAATDGTTILVIGGALYEVLPMVDAGTWPGTPAAAREAGRILARMHLVLATLPLPPGEPPPGAGQALRALDHLGRALPSSRPAVDRLRHDLETASEVAARPRPIQPIHGDFHPGNTLWRGDTLAAVLDFEHMRSGPALADAAIASLHFSLDRAGSDPGAWPDAPNLDRLTQFWAGYRLLRPLARAEAAEIPHLMVAGLIAEAAPRACHPGGFGSFGPQAVLPALARNTAWLIDHAGGLAAAVFPDDR